MLGVMNEFTFMAEHTISSGGSEPADLLGLSVWLANTIVGPISKAAYQPLSGSQAPSDSAKRWSARNDRQELSIHLCVYCAPLDDVQRKPDEVTMQAGQVKCDEERLNEACSRSFLNRRRRFESFRGRQETQLELEECAIRQGAIKRTVAAMRLIRDHSARLVVGSGRWSSRSAR